MFYERLEALLKEKRITKKRFLEEVGLSKNSMRNWELRGNIPSSAILTSISQFLGVSVDYLKGITSERSSKKIIKVPVYGQVAAGIPIEAIENIEDYEELNASDYPVGEYIALKIHGSSMQPKMDEGDVVIVRCQNDVNSGEVAIVMVNGENATCKKIKKTENGIFLISTNPAFEPIFYSNDEIEKLPVRIIGKVVELRAKL